MTAPGSNENDGRVSPTNQGPCGEPHGKSRKDKRRKKWYERTSVTLCVAAALVVIGLGFIHVITGVTSSYELPFDMVRKDRFGYRETLVNAKRIGALPYAVATRRYPLGVRVLQEAGYMPSGLEFEAQMMAQQREDTCQWLAEFEKAVGKTETCWQDQLRGEDQGPPGDPEDARACNHRGVVLARRGEYQSALAEFTARSDARPPMGTPFTTAPWSTRRSGISARRPPISAKSSRSARTSWQAISIRAACTRRWAPHDQAIAAFTQAIAVDSGMRPGVLSAEPGLLCEGRLRQGVGRCAQDPEPVLAGPFRVPPGAPGRLGNRPGGCALLPGPMKAVYPFAAPSCHGTCLGGAEIGPDGDTRQRADFG